MKLRIASLFVVLFAMACAEAPAEKSLAKAGGAPDCSTYCDAAKLKDSCQYAVGDLTKIYKPDASADTCLKTCNWTCQPWSGRYCDIICPDPVCDPYCNATSSHATCWYSIVNFAGAATDASQCKDKCYSGCVQWYVSSGSSQGDAQATCRRACP